MASDTFSTFNGGEVAGKFKWNQDLSEINVQVLVPKGTSGKQVVCEVTKSTLCVGLKGSDTIVSGTLFEDVDAENCFWNLEDKEKVLITISKKRENVWPSVLKGGPEIDTSKVNTDKDFHSFDEETQMGMRKLMAERNDKLREEFSMPSQEGKVSEDILRKAWEAPGSPFAGKPFDPSLINNGQGVDLNPSPEQIQAAINAHKQG